MRIEIQLSDGYKLVAEKNGDAPYKEIAVGIEDSDGYWMQDLAIVGAKYHYDDDWNVVEDNGKYQVRVFADSEKEDYSHLFEINRYEEE